MIKTQKHPKHNCVKHVKKYYERYLKTINTPFQVPDHNYLQFYTSFHAFCSITPRRFRIRTTAQCLSSHKKLNEHVTLTTWSSTFFGCYATWLTKFFLHRVTDVTSLNIPIGLTTLSVTSDVQSEFATLFVLISIICLYSSLLHVWRSA
jgi:hypothetical protein